MVLCPTRELADQVTQEIRRLARFEDNIKVLSLVGGSMRNQAISSLENGVHIVVGTPGRIMDHIERGSLKLDELEHAGARRSRPHARHGLLRRYRLRRQALPGAAPDPAVLGHLSGRHRPAGPSSCVKPQEVKLLEQHEESKIRQRFYEVKHEERLHAVAACSSTYRPVSTLAFCNTKQQCRDLLNVLRKQGIHALTLNGDLEQRERDQVLIQFANRSCSVLVATDVAARGLDIDQLEAVINVDVTPDPEIHIHRIGRTGRADQDGWALSLCSPATAPGGGHCRGTGSELECTRSAPCKSRQRCAPGPADGNLLMLGGRKDKIRPGDVLGALTGEAGFHPRAGRQDHRHRPDHLRCRRPRDCR
jgi:ATP-independent RNA helicase DbpA